MDEKLTQEQFLLKFNFQKFLRLDIPDDDYARIGQALAIDPGLVEDILAGFARRVGHTAWQIRLELNLGQITGRPFRIAFVGDSITSDRESYFQIIRQVFATRQNLSFIDAARSGNTTVDLICDLHAGLLAKAPDLACIMIGTNDLKRNDDAYKKIHVEPEAYAQNLDYLVARLLDTGCRVILSTIPPSLPQRVQATYPELSLLFRDEDRDRNNGIIREIAARRQAILNDMADVYEKAGYGEVLMADGMHLNHTGQELLARKLLPKIINALA